jgi:hypothetical protein
VVFLVIGAFLLLISVAVIAIGAAGAQFIDQFDPSFRGLGSAVAAVLVVAFVILLIVSLLHIAAGIGVFMHKSWARWTGIVVAVIGMLFGLLGLLGYTDDPSATAGELLIVVVWLAAYGFSLVGLAAGGRHFVREQPWR